MRLWRMAAAGVAVGFGFCGAALADPHADAKAADSRGDYSAELAILQPAAEAGEVWAENNLGLLYEEGHGVARDNALAAEWLKKAAAKGDRNANLNLMSLYLRGDAKPDDPSEAAALDKGRVMMDFLGVGMNCMLKKPTATEDCPKAQALLLGGANSGDPKFEALLGKAYQAGLYGLDRDPAKGFGWTLKAAEQGDEAARDTVAMAYSFGVGVEKDDAKAIAWWVKAADQGDMIAADMLADSYEQGNGVAKDAAQSLHWRLKAAEAEDTDAQRKVGAAYAFGRGAPRDDVKAYAWIDIALTSPAGREEDRDAQTLALKAVRARLTPSQLTAAKAIVARWKSEHPIWNATRPAG